MFGKHRKNPEKTYDRNELEPVLLSSICTGEKTAGFRDLATGKFRSICLIESEKDLQAFMKEYGIREGEMKTVY